MTDAVVHRLDRVKENVAAAAQGSGRSLEDVTIVVVTKGFPPEAIRPLLDAGHRDLGENRAQELVAKSKDLQSFGPRWHFIGRLQTNKVRLLQGLVSVVHSVDRIEAGEEISKRFDSVVEVLVEVNVSGETSKAGCAPDALPDLIGGLVQLPGLEVTGLMTVPPRGHPEDSRAHFRRLARLRDEMAATFPAANIHQLSMGMSQDYVVAVEEGATFVRVGEAILGRRDR